MRNDIRNIEMRCDNRIYRINRILIWIQKSYTKKSRR